MSISTDSVVSSNVPLEIVAEVFQRALQRLGGAGRERAECVPGRQQLGLERQLVEIAGLAAALLPWPSGCAPPMAARSSTACTSRTIPARRSASRFQIMPTGQVWSSSTIMVPVPMRLPAFCTAVKSMASRDALRRESRSKRRRAAARESCTPSRMPPACSSRISRIVVPIGSSQSPGRFTLPLAPYSLVPPSLRAAQASGTTSAPLLTMCGTLQSVSTLLTIVGLPQEPDDRRERRLGARVGALAFERIQQRVSSPHM